MNASEPDRLLDRVRALPAGAPLLRRLGGLSGVFLVGGAVRDLLLGGEPGDLDLLVEGDPARVAARLGGSTTVHDRFGTATVSVEGFTYDLARARRETYSRPGALPDVAPASVEEDLGRRDFTVNAMALALGGERAGELIAFPGAREDLNRRRLRILHDASFIDDPTRLFRLARYRARLGFEVEPHTQSLLEAALQGGALETVSGARIGNELRLLAREADPVAAFRSLRQLGLDRALEPDFGIRDEALARRAFALLPEGARPDVLMLAAAAMAIRPEELRLLLDRLGFPAGDRDTVVQAASRSPTLARALAEADQPSAIARAAYGVPRELVALAGGLGPEAQAREWLSRLSHVRLEIDGRDLLAAGVPEGPALGRGLRAALAAKLDGRAEGRDEELAVALEASRSSG